jgi:LPXTG-motif cell wall-anchored protein
VTVTNTGGEPVTITELVDDVYPDIASLGTCTTAVGTVLVPAPGPGNVYTCAFTGSFTGTAGDSQTDTVTATAIDDEDNEAEASDTATVTLEALPVPGTGTITIRKVVDEYDTGQEFPFDASYDPDGFSLEAGEANLSGPLAPGTYSVEELVPDGWDLESVVCSDGSPADAIVLDADETVVCTFTNLREPGYDGDPTDDFDSPFDDAGDPGTPDPSGDTAGGNDQTGQQPAPTPVPAHQQPVLNETTARPELEPARPVVLAELPRTGDGLDRLTLMGLICLVLGGLSIMFGRRRRPAHEGGPRRPARGSETTAGKRLTLMGVMGVVLGGLSITFARRRKPVGGPGPPSWAGRTASCSPG